MSDFADFVSTTRQVYDLIESGARTTCDDFTPLANVHGRDLFLIWALAAAKDLPNGEAALVNMTDLARTMLGTDDFPWSERTTQAIAETGFLSAMLLDNEKAAAALAVQVAMHRKAHEAYPHGALLRLLSALAEGVPWSVVSNVWLEAVDAITEDEIRQDWERSQAGEPS